MPISFDPAKNQQNIDQRGISFDLVARFAWISAQIQQDRRRDYSEPRFQAIGFIDSVLHVLIFTPRRDGLRVISLRRANRREREHYEQATRS